MTERAALRKKRALGVFLTSLFENGVKNSVAKVILFGSYAEGRARPSSDVDVLVLASDSLSRVEAACDDAQLEAAMATGESVEPIVKCLDEARFINSLFMDHVMHHGREVYSMSGEELKKKESRNYLELAQEFLDSAEKVLDLDLYRTSLDSAYNACELAAKGLILKKAAKLPMRHSGVVGRFSELYVQTGLASKEVGRTLNRALRKRNQARYEPHAEITEADVKAVIALGKELTALLEQQL